MNFKFVPMNLGYANEIIDNWKYGDEYHIYDYVNEKELLLNEESWGVGKFAVLDEENYLAGEFTVEFFQEDGEELDDEGYVSHEVVKNSPQNCYEMWVGWGLKPELCGKGLGVSFVSQCIDFAVREYNYKGQYVRCGVAAFNKRAIKVYEKCNFEIFYTCESEIAGEKLTFLRMRKKIS